MMKTVYSAIAALVLGALFVSAPGADEIYKKPPKEVVDILDAPPTPVVIVAPTRNAMLLAEYQAYPSIELLSRPFLKLAGVRVDPARNSRQRIRQYTGFQIQDLRDGTEHRVALPAGARLQLPAWSYDGRRLAFARDLDDGVELWVADAATGEARALGTFRLNDVLGAPFEWTSDNRHLLVKLIPARRGQAPEAPRVPAGPLVQETAGKQSRMATFRDLLETAHDEALFEHYGTSQLALVDAETGALTPLGGPALYTSAEFSPDDGLLLVKRLQRPYSYRVPYMLFTRTIEVWKRDGTQVQTLVNLPIADEVPQQGVPKGPRDVEWQPLVPATIVWAEALDGGDPRAKVPHRDKLMRLVCGEKIDAGAAREVARFEERFEGLQWTGRVNQALVEEYDRDRRWQTVYLVDIAASKPTPRHIYDRSINDDYNNPGNPVWTTRPDGESTLLQDGDWIYLSGRGATAEGDRPFLDRFNLKSLQKERLFLSATGALEFFVAFAPGDTRKSIVLNRQSRTEPPNWFRMELGGTARTQLTYFKDPAPQLTGLEKRLLKYHRADGVPLTGFLYLPPGYQPGTRLPCILWAYPEDFSDPATAGQVRGSPHSFTRLYGDSPLFFLTQGYAVMMDATMPVIGDPETMNDTYVEQVVAAARAAVDTLDAMGVVDRNRIAVAGHSYGAFMTATLLAHSDLFAAGIARSGAYNRSLTPFGFQAERRSYWDATDVYTRLSPFTYANKINEPILMTHGKEDNNSGTFPIQSERLFQALQGNGGTARLVMLPFEGHGYRARESVLHVLAEMFAWADTYVKNRPASASAPAAAGSGQK